MAIGQSSGPPATARQLAQLTELILAAGHSDFRDARGPMGFTSRQAAGRFSRDEAEAFIEQLEAEADHASNSGADSTERAEPVNRTVGRTAPQRVAKTTVTDTKPAPTTTPTRTKIPTSLRTIPAEILAAELQRRGWIVVEP